MSDFTSVAKSRARYYCKGAPVQFVHVELLRMEETGQLVVTLMFKNIAAQPLTAFTAHFRCKTTQGEVIMEDDFYYNEMHVAEGECFGTDDAVYLSDVPLSSVEVNLVSAQYGENAPTHSLTRCQPVPLPALKPMPHAAAAYVNRVLQQQEIRWMPNPVQDGWQCGCGAFNYNTGIGAGRCTECGAGKTALLTAVRAALQGGAGIPGMQAEEPRSAAAMAQHRANTAPTFTDTASYDPPTQYERAATRAGNAMFDEAPTAVVSSQQVRAGAAAVAEQRMSIMSKETAKFILNYVPYITAGASFLYILLALFLNWLIG